MKGEWINQRGIYFEYQSDRIPKRNLSDSDATKADPKEEVRDDQFMLRLENYETTIDYVELLTRNPRGNFMWGLEDQIIRRCSPRTGPLFETTA